MSARESVDDLTRPWKYEMVAYMMNAITHTATNAADRMLAEACAGSPK
jgi:hypothetical protein